MFTTRSKTALPIVLALACLAPSARSAEQAQTAAAGPQPNPLYLPLGPASYARVFGEVLDAVGDFFDVAYSNRYDGRIETRPAAVASHHWGNGYAEFHQRWLGQLLSTRHRAVARITTADDGGFFIEVKVFRERRQAQTDPPGGEGEWVPDGRDHDVEQAILRRLARR